MTAHDWVQSTLGHGDAMCRRCRITNREAAVLGRLTACERAEPAAPPAAGTRTAAEILLAGILNLDAEAVAQADRLAGAMTDAIEAAPDEPKEVDAYLLATAIVTRAIIDTALRQGEQRTDLDTRFARTLARIAAAERVVTIEVVAPHAG